MHPESMYLLSPSPLRFAIFSKRLVCSCCILQALQDISFFPPPSLSFFVVSGCETSVQTGLRRGARARARAFGAILDLGGLGRRGKGAKGGLLLEGRARPSRRCRRCSCAAPRTSGRTDERTSGRRERLQIQQEEDRASLLSASPSSVPHSLPPRSQ